MSIFASFDWKTVREQYDVREATHYRLLGLHRENATSYFLDLLLGISEPSGNYSASEHNIGPKILVQNENIEIRLHHLAEKFLRVSDPHQVPPLIREASIRFLQIGVGSEMSCMLNPDICYVANVRTIWTHLVLKHADNFAKANEELKLYRESDVESEMAYQMWRTLHAELAGTITRIAEEGSRLSVAAGIAPGHIKYLWADAMATQLYDENHM